MVSTPEGHILHFTVEGSVVRYGARIPTDPVVGVVTCLAWKGDWIVTGDSAGSLHLWDLKAKVSVSARVLDALAAARTDGSSAFWMPLLPRMLTAVSGMVDVQE